MANGSVVYKRGKRINTERPLEMHRPRSADLRALFAVLPELRLVVNTLIKADNVRITPLRRVAADMLEAAARVKERGVQVYPYRAWGVLRSVVIVERTPGHVEITVHRLRG
jgi:hypothetical protein